MRLTDLKLATRLGGGFAALLVLMLAMAAFDAYELTIIEASNTALDSRAVRMGGVSQWATEAKGNAARAQAIANAGESKMLVDDLIPQVTAANQSITEIQSRLNGLINADDERRFIEDVISKHKELMAQQDKLLQLATSGQHEAAHTHYLTAVASQSKSYIQSLDDLMAKLVGMQATDSKALKQANSQAGAMLAVLSILSVLIGAGLSIAITRSVTGPIKAAMQATERIAAGELNHRIDVEGSDELAALLGRLRDMQTKLHDTIGSVRHATDSISTASSEIASGNQDLSTRTEQTASNLQQTTSSMMQLTTTVRHSAEVAEQANSLATSAAEVAQRGGAVVSQVVTTMEQINNSSKKIADIITVIDGIAFQTNILALNAAVEAARAGDQGRGFAVVAGEVRSLAQRSANAAKEIKTLINTSVENVDSGSRLVGDAGSTMQEIVAAVQRVTEMIAEITASANEQSSSIQDVGQSVSHLDQMTQQNAALVEESAAAAESLKDQAHRLADAVSVFRLSGSVQR